jgi:hypothetical protein
VLIVPVVKATSDARQVEVLGFAGLQVSHIQVGTGAIDAKFVNVVSSNLEVDAKVLSAHPAQHFGAYAVHLVGWKETR